MFASKALSAKQPTLNGTSMYLYTYRITTWPQGRKHSLHDAAVPQALFRSVPTKYIMSRSAAGATAMIGVQFSIGN